MSLKLQINILGVLLCTVFFSGHVHAVEEIVSNDPMSTNSPVDVVRDVRDVKTPLTYQKGDIVVVPIPLSNPTFGTGVIVGGAYFYGQTEQQKKSQPASFTGAAGVYTNNDSYAIGITQQNYWDEDKWRFNAVGGYVDFRLELRVPATDNDQLLDWLVDGVIFQTTLSRELYKGWYLGIVGRYMDFYQELSLILPDDSYALGSNVTSIGGGLNLQYDSRDVPTNAYQGRFFEAQALSSVSSGDVNETYQSYSLRFRSYHQLADPFVLAVDLSWCDRIGKVPLWDTCRLSLRGFPLTDYLGIESYQGQVEARWRAYKKLGFVAFGGYGYVGRSFSDALDNERVPSVGAGVRYMVLESKRINLRVDYARSGNSEAWYLSVGEAF